MDHRPESFKSTLPVSAKTTSYCARAWVNVAYVLQQESEDIKLPLDFPVETSHFCRARSRGCQHKTLHTPGGQRVSSKEHGRTVEPGLLIRRDLIAAEGAMASAALQGAARHSVCAGHELAARSPRMRTAPPSPYHGLSPASVRATAAVM